MLTIITALSSVLFGVPVSNDVPIPETPVVVVEEKYTPPPVIETLEQMSDRIALAHDISTSTLRNLVYSESRWDTKADNGFDRGLVQINRKAWPDVTDEQSLDPEFSLNFAADKLSKGEEYYWVSCSCWAFVKVKIPDLPNMADIVPNTKKPKAGRVVIMQYGKLKHVAYIESVNENFITISESNFTSCLVGKRTISTDDKAIIGYFKV